jgi:hypothetical protein
MSFAQFTMYIYFHFDNKKDSSEVCFCVGEDLERRVPLEIEGIEGLNTVYMLFPKSDLYLANETVTVECRTIAPQLYKGKIKPGLKGRLWESGYFADVEILEVNDNKFI